MRLATVLALMMCAVSSMGFAQTLKVPAGCVAAAGAKASESGYADRVIHEKSGIELVLIRPGGFDMGVATVTRVTLAKPFYMGKTVVTNKQYKQFLASSKYDGARDCDPAYDLHARHLRGKSLMPGGDEYPVVFVSWKNAKAFCKWAGGLDLPSEAEWEYACRAGTTTTYSFGDDPKDIDKYAWTLFNSKGTTQPVGKLLPNAWGLYDMHGNVWEWCLDDEAAWDQPWPADGSAYTAPKGSYMEGSLTKGLRGGSWSNTLQYAVASAARYNVSPVVATNDIGFRVVLRPE